MMIDNDHDTFSVYCSITSFFQFVWSQQTGLTQDSRFKIQDIFIRPVVNTYYYTAFVLLIIGPGRLLLRPVLVAVAAATRFIFKQVLVC